MTRNGTPLVIWTMLKPLLTVMSHRTRLRLPTVDETFVRRCGWIGGGRRRSNKGRDDRLFLEAMHCFTAYNITWCTLLSDRERLPRAVHPHDRDRPAPAGGSSGARPYADLIDETP